MGVASTNPEYNAYLHIWQRNQDAFDGEAKVKARGERYLPIPDPDENNSASPRYQSYKMRAVYTNFTGRTVTGLSGLVFAQDAKVVVPDDIDYVINNFDGNGLSLEGAAQRAMDQCQIKGRYCIATTFPDVAMPEDGSAPTAEQTAGLKPRNVSYQAEDVINWHATDGRLDLLVLKEVYSDMSGDEFEHDEKIQYIVFRLRSEGATYQKYDEEIAVTDEVLLKYADGSSVENIPADIIGAVDNNPSVDNPPISDIAALNIAHYRNSADYEEGVFMTGQPTPHIDTGNTSADDFLRLNPNGVRLGSTTAVVTQGGSMGLVQAQANGAANEAMVRKEEQMVMLGAQIVRPQGGVETAEAAKIRAGAETSTLNTLTKNVSTAIENRLKDTYRFAVDVAVAALEADLDLIQYQLPSDLYFTKPDAQIFSAMIMGRDRGIIAKSDVRSWLKDNRLLDPERTDGDIDTEIETDNPLI